MGAERTRIRETKAGKPWHLWGPYLAERQWGTVREDYSADGNAWAYLTHDASRSRAYRWGEDGIAGISDEGQRLCFAIALWNGRDPILKERLFGVAGPEGNHGEDLKEHYHYLDNTPTHAYMRALYKYPQAEFPYARLLEEGRRRGRDEPEFELLDTGIFDDDRYFDVFVEYAKADPEDVLIRVTAHNRGPEPATLHLLPQLWFRNTWSWGRDGERPLLERHGAAAIATRHPTLGRYFLHCYGAPELLYCDNDTNVRRLYGTADAMGHFKDGIHDRVVGGDASAVNPERRGTKAAAHYRLTVPTGGATAVHLRLTRHDLTRPFGGFEKMFERRIVEADEFYATLQGALEDEDARRVQRQAFAGLLWSKQFYHYDVREWLEGDPAQPTPPPERRRGRNRHWLHLRNADVLSVPDKWEYPWYAAWDLAFHCLPLALVDPALAKRQLLLMTREWYMHPNGQFPSYEWALGDANPPVHAWASWRVYKIEQAHGGGAGDLAFLERVFHKLLLNFTWWVNRKDSHGNNLFEGGFLGLDNIGVFDRNAPLPGGHVEQADGTSWMGMYCLSLLRIALELAQHNPVYQDVANKFFEHFLHIAAAMRNLGGRGIDLWDEEDEFFYDVLHLTGEGEHGRHVTLPLKVRSIVGLIPLFAVETLEPELLLKVPEFTARMEWFLDHRPDLASLISRWKEPGRGERRLLSLLRGHRMKCLLRRMLDDREFLSPHGVRSLSRYHREHPYTLHANGEAHTVGYRPAESDSAFFGGNSNWRGPVWFPVNFLIVESLQKFHHYYGGEFRIECPTGSGRFASIAEVADELARRLTSIFLRDDAGRRPVFGPREKLQRDPHFRDWIPFHEYFHGDDGRGLGAAHQTGWTALVAKLLQPRVAHGGDR